MSKEKIPNKLELSAKDPFLKYLAYMYNSGIDYMTQSQEILTNMEDYKNKLNDFMRRNKLQFIVDEMSGGKNKVDFTKKE